MENVGNAQGLLGDTTMKAEDYERGKHMYEELLSASDFACKSGKLFFVPLNCPYFVVYDYVQGRVLEKKRIRHKGNISSYYDRVIEHNDTLFFLPFWAECVLYYDLQTDELMEIEIEYSHSKEGACGYDAAIVYGNCIYAFKRFLFRGGQGAYGVLEIDCEKKTAKEYKMMGEGTQLPANPYEVIFRRTCALSDNNALLFGRNGSYIYCVERNMLLPAAQSYSNKTISSIVMLDDNSFFMVADDGNIIIWNADTDKQTIYPIPAEIMEDVKNEEGVLSESFGSCVAFGDRVYLFGSHFSCILEFDINENKVYKAWFSEQIAEGKRDKRDEDYCYGQLSRVYVKDGVLMVWNIWKKKFYAVSLETHQIEEKSISLGFSEQDLVYEMKAELEEGIVMEKPGITLNTYLTGLFRG